MKRWDYVAHIPNGSGDAEWQIMGEGKTIAIVDPGMELDDPEKYARLISSVPDMVDALLAIRALAIRNSNPESDDIKLIIQFALSRGGVS